MRPSSRETHAHTKSNEMEWYAKLEEIDPAELEKKEGLKEEMSPQIARY